MKRRKCNDFVTIEKEANKIGFLFKVKRGVSEIVLHLITCEWVVCLHVWHSKNRFGPGFQDFFATAECAKVWHFRTIPFSRYDYEGFLPSRCTLARASLKFTETVEKGSLKWGFLRLKIVQNLVCVSVQSLIYCFLTSSVWKVSFIILFSFAKFLNWLRCASVGESFKQLYIFALLCVCVWKSH